MDYRVYFWMNETFDKLRIQLLEAQVVTVPSPWQVESPGQNHVDTLRWDHWGRKLRCWHFVPRKFLFLRDKHHLKCWCDRFWVRRRVIFIKYTPWNGALVEVILCNELFSVGGLNHIALLAMAPRCGWIFWATPWRAMCVTPSASASFRGGGGPVPPNFWRVWNS